MKGGILNDLCDRNGHLSSTEGTKKHNRVHVKSKAIPEEMWLEPLVYAAVEDRK